MEHLPGGQGRGPRLPSAAGGQTSGQKKVHLFSTTTQEAGKLTYMCEQEAEGLLLEVCALCH